MTTVSGLKAMLREEIGAPLDRIRLMSLGGDDLLDYNKGFVSGCRIVRLSSGLTDSQWLRSRRQLVAMLVDAYSDSDGEWAHGRHDAYMWILGELEGITDPDETVTISRARYNYLLDLEHDAHDFAAKFAERGE